MSQSRYGLPAPFGPSSASTEQRQHLARADDEGNLVQARVAPKRLVSGPRLDHR
jgi:hypothetical protein